MQKRVTIGTDPEFFMKNNKTGKLVSAIPYIKGDKFNPLALPSGGNIQSDNVAVEFATIPANSPEDFVEKLRCTFRDTLSCLPADHSLSVSPSARFPEEELQDEKAKQFGCMPDYCAWELCENNTPKHPDETFRSCGGHIHVGCIDENGDSLHKDSEFLLDDMGKVWMVRGMDVFHGVISTILDNSEAAIERRVLYGKAGCHRPTMYGVEYRALSNWWTKHPMSSMLMASLTEDVVTVIANDGLEAIIEKIGNKSICDYIITATEEDAFLKEITSQIGKDVISSVIKTKKIDSIVGRQIGAYTVRYIINTGNANRAREILDSVLIDYLSEDSKFYLNECIAKFDAADNLSVEWGI